jgi:hypothetical protein
MGTVVVAVCAVDPLHILIADASVRSQLLAPHDDPSSRMIDDEHVGALVPRSAHMLRGQSVPAQQGADHQLERPGVQGIEMRQRIAHGPRGEDGAAGPRDLGPDWHTKNFDPARKTRDLVRQLTVLGHDVTLTPAGA